MRDNDLNIGLSRRFQLEQHSEWTYRTTTSPMKAAEDVVEAVGGRQCVLHLVLELELLFSIRRGSTAPKAVPHRTLRETPPILLTHIVRRVATP
jgi:hypothetical protein